jgi:hypothetical protein
MNKLFLFTLCLIGLSITAFGQSNVTNNNTITIQGNVYYFKPSTSPSSPLPDAKYSSGWIGDGEWWGEDAAKAWASIVDWVVLHCYKKADLDYYNKNQTNVYINRLSAKRTGNTSRAEIRIYYWMVDKGKKMEEGKPDYQIWSVEF